MASPLDKLADSLAELERLQQRGTVAIQSRDLSRTHRERLLRNGFLEEVMKGWYIPCRPDEQRGESTTWYASYWDFCAAYLAARFDDAWSLSPEQSLALHTGTRSVPQQLLMRAPGARNRVTNLAHGTSLFESRASLPDEKQLDKIDNLQVFSLPAALVQVGPTFFKRDATDARTALAMLKDASALLVILLEGGHSTVAGRLAGAFRNIGRDRIADDIVKSMKAAGYAIRETDPFKDSVATTISSRSVSPYVNRMQLMWQHMREGVLEVFPPSPGSVRDIDSYLDDVEDSYVTDAYHSLSIEGYRVSRGLIERVQAGDWNPDSDDGDRQQRDALAARGYHLAFQVVKESIRNILAGQNPGDVIENDHADWYREMFSPSVQSGILRPSDLVGYRNDQVYIRRSTHVLPRHEAVRALMPAFFELLRDEKQPAARIVLGHYFFVYIHPYMDGNGRLGTFLMNVMMAAAGFPWTVIPVERRDDYMAALEKVCTDSDIKPLAALIGELIR